MSVTPANRLRQGLGRRDEETHVKVDSGNSSSGWTNSMKPRHATAFAVVGWYLMSPPVYVAPYTGDSTKAWTIIHAPLSQWTSAAFDTAAACETELASRQAMDARGTAERKDPLSVALHQSTSMMMCVASDDPRLAK